MLRGEQRRDLAERGVARLPGMVERAIAADIEDRVWAQFERRGIRRRDPSTWPEGFTGRNQGLRHARVFEPFDNAATRAVVDDLLGAGAWEPPRDWGLALVTFPERGEWTVPHRVWHVDFPARGDPARPDAVRMFGYVVDVGPRGGGTLVVEGSHELVRRMVLESPGLDAGSSSRIRRRLVARHPWFAALCREGGDRLRPFMEDGDEIDGVRVRVAELTGAAGDVVVIQPWTMHNRSVNASATPRIVVSHTALRTGNAIWPASA